MCIKINESFQKKKLTFLFVLLILLVKNRVENNHQNIEKKKVQ